MLLIYNVIAVINVSQSIIINISFRAGASSQTYTVPTADNTAEGSYTCLVTVLGVSSSESAEFSLTAAGI